MYYKLNKIDQLKIMEIKRKEIEERLNQIKEIQKETERRIKYIEKILDKSKDNYVIENSIFNKPNEVFELI
jgi:D-hexose-6-phosphate mutarotase